MSTAEPREELCQQIALEHLLCLVYSKGGALTVQCLLLCVQPLNATINIDMLSKRKVRISKLRLSVKQGCFKEGVIKMSQILHHWLLRAIMFCLQEHLACLLASE